MPRCPGQDQRFWKPDDIFEAQCPHCGTATEFWKDEPSLKCPECRKLLVNPKLDLGCAEWCQHAEQCLGAMADQEDILCKRLITEAKRLCGRDEERIDLSLRVFQNARQIQAFEGGDARLVAAAAILHNVGDPQKAQELPSIREILFRCGLDSEAADRICELVTACRNQTIEDSAESNILWDAVHLEKLARDATAHDAEQARNVISRTFKTEKGRELARSRLALRERP